MHLLEDGSVGEIADAVFHHGLGRVVGRRNRDAHVNCVLETPDRRYLCAVDNGLDTVKVYRFDHDTGKIAIEDDIHLPMETGPRHMTFSPDSRFVYIVCEITSEVYVYAYNGDDEGVSFERIQVISTKTPGDKSESAGVEIRLSDDGGVLAVTNAGIDTVTAFLRDEETGLISYAGMGMTGGIYPKEFVFFPDFKHFITLNYDSNEVACYKFCEGYKGFLTTSRPVKLQHPNCISIAKIDN